MNCYKCRVLLVILVSVCLGGCGKMSVTTLDHVDKPIEITAIFTVDPVTNLKSNEELVENFNKAYEGIYYLNVEWMMDTADEYRARIKQLNVVDNLPTIITDVSFSPAFYELMVEDGRLVDLSTYIKEDKEWLNAVDPQVLDTCTQEQGEIYLSPLGTDVYSSAGIFWNKELFAKAQIESFPQTWEEFFDCCDQLKEQGITPLALHTRGTAWAPMLLATAALGDTPEGLQFMRTKLPVTYRNESGEELVQMIERLFTYTTDHAVNRDFDVAFEDFFEGRAAMIPNGYWMLDQFDEEWKEKTGFAAFPENVLVSSTEMSGWAVSSSATEEMRQAAVAFLKYRTITNRQQEEIFLQASKRETSSLEKEYVEAVGNPHTIVPNYQIQWNSILQGQVFDTQLPRLIAGEITAEEMIKSMDESIRLFEEEQ